MYKMTGLSPYDKTMQQNLHRVMWVGKGLTYIFCTSYCNIMIEKQCIDSGLTREKMPEIHVWVP